jgi:malate synthase
MTPDLAKNIAFNVALQLVKDGTRLANGYSIEPLIKARRKVKARLLSSL